MKEILLLGEAPDVMSMVLSARHYALGYKCGCQALRNGVMKAMHLKPIHEIKESLIQGDGRCVITVTFSP
jgi:hypothetical protein